MKNFSFEISKRNVLFLGYGFILLLFVLNRFTIIITYDKVDALYVDKSLLMMSWAFIPSCSM
jgi:hypothetical protein